MLSGAGISAESGVPTFRDVETGLWAKFDPYELSSADGWQRIPERVWAWYLWRHYLMQSRRPERRPPRRRGLAGPRRGRTSSPRTSTTCTSAPAARRCTTCTAACSTSVATAAVRATRRAARDARAGRGRSTPPHVRLRRTDPARHRVVRRAAARRTPGQRSVEAVAHADVLIVVGTSAHRLSGGGPARAGAGRRHGR